VAWNVYSLRIPVGTARGVPLVSRRNRAVDTAESYIAVHSYCGWRFGYSLGNKRTEIGDETIMFGIKRMVFCDEPTAKMFRVTYVDKNNCRRDAIIQDFSEHTIRETLGTQECRVVRCVTFRDPKKERR
jgi:hypothetical protein